MQQIEDLSDRGVKRRRQDDDGGYAERAPIPDRVLPRRSAPRRQRRVPLRKSKVKKSVVRRAKPKRTSKARVVTVTTKVPLDKTKPLRKVKRLTILKKPSKVMARRSYSRKRMSRGARTDYRNRIRYPVSQYGRIYARRGSDFTMRDFGASAASATPEQLSNRQQFGYTGRGMYDGRGMYGGRGSFWGKSLGTIAGGALGGVVGGPAGAAIGASAGGWLGDVGSNMLEAKYTGKGAYERVATNELMLGSSSSSPQMVSVPDESGSIIISNREYIGDIFAPAVTGVFDVQPFPLNPGLEQTFPWLAQMAANYEEYEFLQLVFEFQSAVSEVNSANGQVGTIIAATNYNATQPQFTDKPAMVSYYGAISSKTTTGFVSGVECDPAKRSGAVGSYVRTNPVLSGEDLKSYDHGLFQIATHNIPNSMLNGTLGELYVVYTIKLRKPKFLTGRGLAITRALFVQSENVAGTLPMGLAATILKGQQNNLNIRLIPTTNSFELTFPAYYAGNLEIRYATEGTSIPAAGVTSFVFGNVTKIADIYGGSYNGGDSPSSEMVSYNATSLIYVLHVKVAPATNATDNKLTIVFSMGAATLTQSSCDIYEYNTSLNGISGAPVLINAGGTVVVP